VIVLAHDVVDIGTIVVGLLERDWVTASTSVFIMILDVTSFGL
jgi:hypothetical protein